MLDHARAHGIEYDVARQFQQVAVSFDQYRLEATLKHVTDATMPAIDILGVHAIELAHTGRQIGLGGFDDEVVMVGHLAPGMHRPVVALAALGE